MQNCEKRWQQNQRHDAQPPAAGLWSLDLELGGRPATFRPPTFLFTSHSPPLHTTELCLEGLLLILSTFRCLIRSFFFSPLVLSSPVLVASLGSNLHSHGHVHAATSCSHTSLLVTTSFGSGLNHGLYCTWYPIGAIPLEYRQLSRRDMPVLRHALLPMHADSSKPILLALETTTDICSITLPLLPHACFGTSRKPFTLPSPTRTRRLPTLLQFLPTSPKRAGNHSWASTFNT
jgi:hypothetical protein